MEPLARLLDGSRMSRETHVRFCEGLGVKFPRSTLQVFRVLKSGLGLSGCQQHSMWAQGIFISACLLLFSYLEIVSGGKPYTALASVISGNLKPETLITEEFVMQP
jgi:hypothetical protein